MTANKSAACLLRPESLFEESRLQRQLRLCGSTCSWWKNSSGTAQSQVEDALFGINHDGTHTNWFRNSVTGTSLPATPTFSDGLFFDIGADGNGGGGAPHDFAAWSGPTYTNTVNVIGPTNFLSRLATSTRQIFKSLHSTAAWLRAATLRTSPPSLASRRPRGWKWKSARS